MKTLRLRRVGAWAAAAGGSLADFGIRVWPRPKPATARCDDGAIQVRDGLVLADFAGTPTEIGAQAGTLLGAQLRPMLRLMMPAVLPRRLDGTLPGLVAGIPDELRTELAAVAKAAGVDHGDLMATNVTVDAFCSALVRGPSADFAQDHGRSRAHTGRPLRVARNMDFFPAEAIGSNTVLTVFRPAGRHAFVSVGWPGYAGVVSGMNAHGLVGCILLRHAAPPLGRPGTPPPMACRVRQVLETCATVEEALAEFSRPVASGHYLLLADATTAALAWHDRDLGMQVHHLHQDWLCADNAERHRNGLALGERAVLLGRLALQCQMAADAGGTAASAPGDAAWMRRTLTAVYQNGINAQAMLFEPATRTLQVATGTAVRPAATGTWRTLDLGRALDGDGLDTVTVDALPKGQILRHFTLP
jgi:hypothetical protein